MTATADRYCALTVTEAAAFLDAIGLPHGTPVTISGHHIAWEATARPLDAWRLLQSGERKPTPISYSGVKGRVEKRHGELLKWEETGDGEAVITFRVLRNGL
jgi:hypothetical protein